MTEAALALLLYFVLPLWVLAGFADYLCHRATDIEHTTGTRESLVHLLLFAEAGIPLLAALFLEINAGIILLMIAGLLLHELTVWLELRYVVSRREVRPVEQLVHSFLEILPLTGLLIVLILKWPQFLALLGLGSEPARFELVPRVSPLSGTYIAALLAGVVLLDLAPFVEELLRGMRARRMAVTAR